MSLILVLALPLALQAQTEAEAPSEAEAGLETEIRAPARKIQSDYSIGLRLLPNAGELDAGFHQSEIYRFSAVFGFASYGTTTTGGDLQAWQYVEEQSQLAGQFAMAQVEGRVWSSPSARHAVYLSSAAGAMKSKAKYSRDRYKPYNGAICIGSCSKSLEESVSQEAALDFWIARAGANYSYVINRDNRGWLYTFDLGATMLHVFNPQERTLGNTQYHATLGSDLIAKGALHAGLNVRF
ncbi:MAG: hypothetical protein V4760_16390 [Bdellovibrionota bacterium]